MLRPTDIPGLVVVEMPAHVDARGGFSRVYCKDDFTATDLPPVGDQWSLSTNLRRRTLRGLHYQAPPHLETKLVRCVAGAAFDAVVDLRPESPTFGRHFTIELSAENGLALFIPRGLAHGFLTLRDDTTLLYGISPPYVRGAARGLRWNDPTVAVPWPMPPAAISDRDADLPLWDAAVADISAAA